jgi:hypothetical protein
MALLYAQCALPGCYKRQTGRDAAPIDAGRAGFYKPPPATTPRQFNAAGTIPSRAGVQAIGE